jgi:hypothetical protein
MADEARSRFFTGMNTRDAIREAQRLGVSVAVFRRTGDLELSHPLLAYVHRAPHPTRRKDGSRAMIAFLRKVESMVNSDAQ